MPSTAQRAANLTRESIVFALVPAVASLLSLSKIARALASQHGGGVTFPFPTGLPTLWTYVSLPSGPGGATIGGPLSIATFVPLFILGLVLTSALEAGFLGSLFGLIGDRDVDFLASAERFTLRMIGVNLIRAAVVFLVAPLLFFPPLAFAVIIGAMYLIYGLPFEIVVRDVGVVEALESTASTALDGGAYAGFGIAHLVGGAAGSILLTAIVRNAGMVGIIAGIALVSVPALYVAIYGLLVFRDLAGTGPGPTGTSA